MKTKSFQTIEDREIRVFISSTFRDLQQEREELVKFVFPKLRALCEERGVTWGEVDLRWGVSDEQKAEGKVLPICLTEIQHCRPFFIGILAERYGWIPDSLPDELIRQQPWLEEHREKSVTDLEIHYGVFHDPEMSGRAFFYLRDPGYLDTLPPEQQREFREHAFALDIARYGEEEAERRAGKRRRQLDELKQHVRSAFPDRTRDFLTSRELGELVFQDMLAQIERFFPADAAPDPLQRDAFEHEQFARSRSRVYIGREEYFRQLDEHALGQGAPLVVLGESGSGKSALLANWAARFRNMHPDALLLMHFIGATSYSADWALMLRRLMGELQRTFHIDGEIPDQPDALRQAFANWLHMAAARGRIVMILDALNQLEDREGAQDLVWLPAQLPSSVRMILSTLPGRPLQALQQRNWPAMAIAPFTDPERRAFILKYLAQYTKTLGVQQTARIATASQTANPLYLQSLLEELRLFGEHESLDQRIEDYLQAKTIPELYEKILIRYETDYERDRPHLLKDSMSLLWAARRGLSENELLDLLGADGAPLPRAIWAPLFLAARQSLTSRAGMVGFSHDYFRRAVTRRYLPEKEEQQAVHFRLADYFGRRETSPRQIDELPWQWAEAGQWRNLADLLTMPDFFKRAWRANEFEVKAYWSRIEGYSDISLVGSYGTVMTPADEDTDLMGLVSTLFANTGHLDEALAWRARLVDYFREIGDSRSLQASLGHEGRILYFRGDLDQAMILYKEQERICRELGEKDGLQNCLGNQGLILYARGDLDQAMILYKEQERICRELGNKNDLQKNCLRQGFILYVRGNLEGAMSLFKEEERICRELGNRDGLQESLYNQGAILDARGDPDGAMRLAKEQERICRELGNKEYLQRSLGMQGLIFHRRGDLGGALRLAKEQERLCREIGNKDYLQKSLGLQAYVLYARGDLGSALRLAKEQERICREMGEKLSLPLCLNIQGWILYDGGDLDGALRLAKEQDRICRETEDRENLQSSLGMQGAILYAKNDPDGALISFKEQERICRELNSPDELWRCLYLQARLLFHLKQQPSLALPLCREVIDVLSRSGLNPDALAEMRQMLKDGQPDDTSREP